MIGALTVEFERLDLVLLFVEDLEDRERVPLLLEEEPDRLETELVPELLLLEVEERRFTAGVLDGESLLRVLDVFGRSTVSRAGSRRRRSTVPFLSLLLLVVALEVDVPFGEVVVVLRVRRVGGFCTPSTLDVERLPTADGLCVAVDAGSVPSATRRTVEPRRPKSRCFISTDLPLWP